MQYTMLIYETPADLSARTDPEQAPAYWAAYTGYSQALAEAPARCDLRDRAKRRRREPRQAPSDGHARTPGSP